MARLTFELKPEHVKLLRNSFVIWEDGEFGAATIDPKRPYGNSDVVEDILTILGLNPELAEDEKYIEIATALHKETQQALQVILSSGSFEPGIYETPDQYEEAWRKIA